MSKTNKPWIVLKFGGTSVASAAQWKRILNITQDHLENGARPLLVCSALSGVSNLLDKAFSLATVSQDPLPIYHQIAAVHRQLAEELNLPLPAGLQTCLLELQADLQALRQAQETTPRDKAHIMSRGELMSTLLGQAWLEKHGLPLRWLDARDYLQVESEAGVSETRHYLTAHCDHTYDATLSRQLAEEVGVGAITQGFIARDAENETVLLGRGGSDTSAALLAARLGALELEIWTDVPGIYTANPRLIPEARLIRSLDYDDAEVMAYRGAKVLHPCSLAPVRAFNIPLRIRCTGAPHYEGTLVTRQNSRQEAGRVRAISSRASLCLVSARKADHSLEAHEFLERFTQVFRDGGLSFHSLTTSSEQVSVTLDTRLEALASGELEALLEQLNVFARAQIHPQVGSVSLIGSQVGAALPQIGSALEPALDGAELRQMLHGSDNRDLTLIVEGENTQDLVKSLHRTLIEAQDQIDLGPSWLDFKRESDFSRRAQPVPALQGAL